MNSRFCVSSNCDFPMGCQYSVFYKEVIHIRVKVNTLVQESIYSSMIHVKSHSIMEILKGQDCKFIVDFQDICHDLSGPIQ